MKIVFVFFGCLFLALGAVGVAIPVLPTTPFLLLAAACFAKGSGRFHSWFISTKLYKKHVESFVRDKAMTMKAKLCILIPVSLLLMLSFFIMSNIPGRIVIVLLIAFKYYYFFAKIRTI